MFKPLQHLQAFSYMVLHLSASGTGPFFSVAAQQPAGYLVMWQEMGTFLTLRLASGCDAGLPSCLAAGAVVGPRIPALCYLLCLEVRRILSHRPSLPARWHRRVRGGMLLETRLGSGRSTGRAGAPGMSHPHQLCQPRTGLVLFLIGGSAELKKKKKKQKRRCSLCFLCLASCNVQISRRFFSTSANELFTS